MEGELAMIRPESQTVRLLRKACNLLGSVAEAAWTNDLPSPAKWDLHRIGTQAYLAQRDILDLQGQDADSCEALPCIEIAAALQETAHTLATIPQAFRDLDTRLLKERSSSIAQRCPDQAYLSMGSSPDGGHHGGEHEPRICHYR